MAPANGATVSYQAQAWQMADELRGSMDAAERPRIDPDFEEATEGEEVERKERLKTRRARLKTRRARLEAVVGTECRQAGAKRRGDPVPGWPGSVLSRRSARRKIGTLW